MTQDILKDFWIVLVDITAVKCCMTCFVLFLGEVVKQVTSDRALEQGI